MLTPNYAVLSSDRRITVDVTDPLAAGGARVHLQEDTDTKTILVDQRYVMGFAGLGRVREDLLDPLTGEQRRTRVETWVTSDPAPVDPTHYFDALAERFGRVCEAQRWNRPHQFVALGYRTNGPFGATDP